MPHKFELFKFLVHLGQTHPVAEVLEAELFFALGADVFELHGIDLEKLAHHLCGVLELDGIDLKP